MSAGLGGFVLGALTVLFIVWAYAGFRTESGLPTAAPVGSQVEVQPAPAETPPVLPAAPPTQSGPSRPWVQGGPAAMPTPASPAPTPQPGAAESPDLRQRNLVLPVQGITPEKLQNTYDDSRSGGRVHEAIDILAPRNTPVLAVEDGRVAKLFTSKQGGLTIYQFDPTEAYAYYYAHLERYADGVKEGVVLRRGQVIGYVGTSGNAPPETPHLHFAIFRLTPEKRWWEGDPINPFAILGGGRGADRVEPAR
ncbi:MAG TPA: peptidoglycan DD-metalloendopeptidase family protein [Thermoanaerobaculia bacterium]|nr:peptidoglycan DD-metalloendopeptidase family protein [Thermoanaerobaculia bacterium]